MSRFVDLSGKTILVTGGSRGIGEGIVRGVAAEGANVVFNYRKNASLAAAIVKDIGANRCLAMAADLNDPAQIDQLWETAVRWKGHVDVLVNSASSREAVAIDAPTAEWDARWIHALRVNLLAAGHLSRRAIGHYKGRDGGIIIGITTRNAVRGDRPEYFHEAASKAGMNSLMRGIARFCAKDKIYSYLVCGGMVETDQFRIGVEKFGYDVWTQEMRLDAPGKPQDIANVVVFLASGKAQYATGATIDAVGATFIH